MTTALVAGASSGIGLEIARILARDHNVVLAARSVDKLDALASELGGARFVAVDLSDPAGPSRLVAEVPAVDVLVNNAGFADWGPFAAAPEPKLYEMNKAGAASVRFSPRPVMRRLVHKMQDAK